MHDHAEDNATESSTSAENQCSTEVHKRCRGDAMRMREPANTQNWSTCLYCSTDRQYIIYHTKIKTTTHIICWKRTGHCTQHNVIWWLQISSTSLPTHAYVEISRIHPYLSESIGTHECNMWNLIQSAWTCNIVTSSFSTACRAALRSSMAFRTSSPFVGATLKDRLSAMPTKKFRAI